MLCIKIVFQKTRNNLQQQKNRKKYFVSSTKLTFDWFILMIIQNISPGLVENDILTTQIHDNNELVKYMPRLKPEDVAHTVIFAITTPQHVLVSRMFIL